MPPDRDQQYPDPPIEIETHTQQQHTEIGTEDTAHRVRGRAWRRDPRPGRTASGLRTRIGNVRQAESWIASNLFGRSRDRFFKSIVDCQLRIAHHGG